MASLIPEGTFAKVAVIPDCDLCKRLGNKVPAIYDAVIPSRGVWAYLCMVHATMHRIELGVGKGQQLIKVEEVNDGQDDPGRAH